MDATSQIKNYIESFQDWRGETLTTLYACILKADPQIKQEWKWSVPVFTYNGLVCAISAFKNHVKINFFKGVKLKDPDKLINAGLDSKSFRSIDFFVEDKVPEEQLIHLVREAIRINK